MTSINLLKNFQENKRIYRLAGIGVPGYSGDGGPANQACLNGPAGLGIDSQDNLFIADLLNHVIRKVDSTTKIITTVAGSGQPGYSGDGQAATAATLNAPEGVCVDREGNIYIADSGNHRIRYVQAATGVIRTIAGTGDAGFNGYDGVASSMTLNHPSGVVANRSGRVFFNDYGNDLIRSITKDGYAKTYVGTGESGYAGDLGNAQQARINDVYGIGMDIQDNLYFVDSLNFAIRKVDHRSEIIETIIGKGVPGELEEFVYMKAASLCGQPHQKGTIGSRVAHGVDVDAQGNIYVAESGIHRLRMVDAETKLYFTIAGTGESGIPEENGVAIRSAIDLHGVRVDTKGKIYMVDFTHHIVSVIV